MALQYRGALDITDTDFEIASREYPEHISRFQEATYQQDKFGLNYPWYSPIYSAACIPVKWVVGLTDIDLIYSFYLSNALFIWIALLTVLLKLDASYKIKLVVMLLLEISPILILIKWASAEVFVYMLVTMTAVFWHRKSYKPASFCIALAGMLNITAIMVGVVLVGDYIFHCLFSGEKKDVDFIKVLKHSWKDILLTALCYLPFIIHIIWMVIHFNSFTMQTSPLVNKKFTEFQEYIFIRFVTYLFDLNMGFFPYYPILITMFILYIPFGVYKKQRWALVGSLAFLLTVFAYSLMSHINCGMEGMSRYNNWMTPLLVITVALEYGQSTGKLQIAAYYSAMVMSVAWCGFNTKITNNSSYIEMLPVAKFVLDRAPQIYNPYYATFISRTVHVDGGYYYLKPVYYASDDGFIRKILMDNNTRDLVANEVFGDRTSLEQLNNQVTRHSHDDDVFYVNIHPESKIMLRGNSTEYRNEEWMWLQEKTAPIVLQEPDSSFSGYRFKIEHSGYILQANPEKEVLLNIVINDELVVQKKLEQSSTNTFDIPMDKLPDSISGNYIFKLTTNCHFVPAELGLNDDDSELMVILRSITVVH